MLACQCGSWGVAVQRIHFAALFVLLLRFHWFFNIFGAGVALFLALLCRVCETPISFVSLVCTSLHFCVTCLHSGALQI